MGLANIPLANITKDNQLDFGKFSSGSNLIIFGKVSTDNRLLSIERVIDVTKNNRYSGSGLTTPKTNGHLVVGSLVVGAVVLLHYLRKRRIKKKGV